MIHIDPSACIGCGLCVRDCPQKNLTVENGCCAVKREVCLGCGHCVAICPQRAVSQDDSDMTTVEPVGFLVPPEDFLLQVKSRRSIRRFTEQKITREVAEQILEAGRFTETAKNTQGVRYVFLQNELAAFKALVWEGWRTWCEAKEAAGDPDGRRYMVYYRRYERDPADDRLFFNAPAALAVLSKHPVDGGLAAANIENMAVAMGLGVLFDGYVVEAIRQSPAAQAFLNAGDTPVVAVLLLGYPAVSYTSTAPRRPVNVEWK